MHARVRFDGPGNGENSNVGVNAILPQKWAPLFSIKTFVKEHQNIKPDNFHLGRVRLEALAIQVSQLRNQIEAKAKRMML